uniref:Uncharacterized protein n=1 Tax=Nelumbo nucifera TaxID=4432 RepID=A0A822Y2A5_NELNU|nr:TPA_asm: hypothetical protein HUJ06_028218 [Nelumbo nucifera]
MKKEEGLRTGIGCRTPDDIPFAISGFRVYERRYGVRTPVNAAVLESAEENEKKKLEGGSSK